MQIKYYKSIINQEKQKGRSVCVFVSVVQPQK